MQTAKRILLVEDDKDDQELLCDVLKEIYPTINCQVANNGLEALTLLDSPPAFDIVFLDLNMPKMNGFQCLEVLKADPSYKHLPVVIFSTSNRKEDIIRCKDLGAAYFFTKPSSYRILFETLRNILSSPTLV
jgi:CheY-like chemotaxis protein